MEDRVDGLVQIESPLVSRSFSWLKRGWVLVSLSLHLFHNISFIYSWLPQDQTQSPWGVWPGITQNPSLGSNLTSLGEDWGMDYETMKIWQSPGVCDPEWQNVPRCQTFHETQVVEFLINGHSKRALYVIWKRDRNSKPNLWTDGEVPLQSNRMKAEISQIPLTKQGGEGKVMRFIQRLVALSGGFY